MTIVVAARRNGKVIMGADSLTTIGDKKMVQMKNKSKLYRFKHFVVGIAGMGPLTQVLDRMRRPSAFSTRNEEEEAKDTPEVDWNEAKIESEDDCALFLQQFMTILSELGESDDMSSVELLICTSEKIFTTNGTSEYYEIEDFWAIGSGAPFALGCLDMLWTFAESPANMLRSAVAVACKYCAGCEGPIEILNLSSFA